MPEDLFDRYAEEYDRWFEEHPDEYHAELAWIRRVIPPIDSRAIEVGVGSGRFAAPLGIRLGIEPSRALGRMARRRGIEIIRGRAESIPIRNGSCSFVLLVTVICFLDDPPLAFRELHRILAPRGILVLLFIERGGRLARTYLHGGGNQRFLSRARFYSSGEVKEFLKDGYLVISVESRAGLSVIVAQKEPDNKNRQVAANSGLS